MLMLFRRFTMTFAYNIMMCFFAPPGHPHGTLFASPLSSGLPGRPDHCDRGGGRDSSVLERLPGHPWWAWGRLKGKLHSGWQRSCSRHGSNYHSLRPHRCLEDLIRNYLLHHIIINPMKLVARLNLNISTIELLVRKDMFINELRIRFDADASGIILGSIWACTKKVIITCQMYTGIK